jgi:CHAT domain-containing protein/tetratricopeptide (TPR) repeat protein
MRMPNLFPAAPAGPTRELRSDTADVKRRAECAGQGVALRGTRTCAVAVLLGLLSQGAHAAQTFDACAELVAAEPAAYESYRCYFEVASSTGEWQSAGRHLSALEAARPRIDWIVFVRGLVTWPLDKAAAERLYLEAARRFEASENVRGEVLARANLYTLLYESGRIGSAVREVDRITSLAERTEDPEIRIRARVVESQFFINTGTNLGRAQRALQQAEADLERMPTYWLRHHVLHGLGSVFLLTGQYDEALTYYRRLLEEAGEQQDLSTVALAHLEIANALLEKRSEEPDAVDARQLFADAEEALAAAKRAQDVDLELGALQLLGEVLMIEQDGRARLYVDACIGRAEAQRRSQFLSQCLWVRARLLAARDPIAAQRAIARAIDLLHHEEGSDDASLAYAWRHAMRVAWQTQSQDAAIATGKQALAAIERMRDLQPGLQDRAAAFSTWTQDYYWLSGQVLRQALDPALSTDAAGAERARVLLNEGFQIGERMRARSLLDRLRARERPPTDIDAATRLRRETLSKSIVDINRQLLRSRGHPSAELKSALAALERQEADAREATEQPRVAMQPASLAQIQERLASDEMLLSFQLGVRDPQADRNSAGAWLIAITRQQAAAFALPDRHELRRSMALYNGLKDESPARARAGLAIHEALLRHAFDQMPRGTKRLIVVPDSPLDMFPVSSLSGSLDYEPLAKRYEIVLVPSATLWYEWGAAPDAVDARGALVLADPEVEVTADLDSPWRSWSDDGGLSLGRLPQARTEGLEIIERLRGRGTLLTGAQASEAALKSSDLSRYGVLHFATHTIIDTNAERSAILLASGTSIQDGLLQSREIADLPLDGQIVVLSACQSATGTQVRGEGVLGLARAFFAAGARVVVGSLRPVRDDHARAFFDPFYAALGEGRTVGAAFHEAQRRLIDQGLPAQAWAGFILMGDANATVVSTREVAQETLPTALTGAAIIMLLILASWSAKIWYSKRRASRSHE